jgi:alpha-glucosidase
LINIPILLFTKPFSSMKNFIIFSLLFAMGCSTGPHQKSQMITSPDGNVQFILSDTTGKLTYSVVFNKNKVIENSPLVISVDSVDITTGATIEKTKSYQVNETYPWYGAHATAVNHCNGVKVSLAAGKTGLHYTLDVRAYNNGVAFRWMIPGDSTMHRVPDEATGFTLPAGSTAWYHNLRMHYEGIYDKKGLDTVQAGEWAAPPVTSKLPAGAGYVSITEADLVDYSGMALQTNGKHGFILRLAQHQPVSYPYELRYSKADVERSLQPAVITGTIATPWRIVIVGADLNSLVNNDIVHNLCPPPDKSLFPEGIKTSWIKPGRAVWKYLDDGGPSTPENMKRFSKLAGKLGFQYNILEGFWAKWSDDTMKDLINYSNRQGVGIWVWKHSKELRDPEKRQAFFQHCHDLGVTGVKIDFFDSEARSVVDLYQSILKETAAEHLLVDFHGADKPTGLARTWPNELNREAVKGMESRSLKDRATHTTILPFARYLAGHADYTPVIFNERRANTTWANQVASAVIIDGALLTYAASPEHILSNPCAEMIESIPAVWDETIVLPPSEIGELAVFARRKGKTWFLAVLNGTKTKHVSIPLSFLGTTAYKATLIRDDKSNSAAVKIEHKTLKQQDKIELDLGEGGGFIGRFSVE